LLGIELKRAGSGGIGSEKQDGVLLQDRFDEEVSGAERDSH